MKKFLSILLIGVLSLTLFAGCGQEVTPQKTSIKIGVTVYDQHDLFISEMMKEFNQYVKDLDAEKTYTINIETYDASNSQSTQNSQVQSMINDGCDVICVNLVDRTNPTAIIELAEKNNVPIIFFNRELVEEDLERWDSLYYVGAEAFESGTMQGELAADYITSHPECDLNSDGVIQYVVLEGEAGHQDAIVRTEYSVSAVEKANISLEKVSYSIANWNRDQAKAKVLQFIDQKENIELILCNNDAMALGAIDAYESAEIALEKRPIILGIDGIDDGLNAIESGTMVASVCNDKNGQAKAMCELAYALGAGTGLSSLELIDGKYIRLPYQKITSDNVADFR